MVESRSMVPPPEPGDTEDVSWALSTANAMEQRGDLVECVRWLRRAAEAASEASKSDRALALAKAAAELTQRLEESTDVGEKPTVQVDRPQTRSKAPQPPIVRPLSSPPRASQTPPIGLRAPPKKAEPTPPPPSAVAPLKPMRGPAPSTTEEWDAMPTQSLSSDDLASISRTAETPSISEEMRIARAAALGVGVHQAVRVRVWRDASGVHIAPAATRVAAPSVEAMLVGLDGTDLHAWLVGAAPRR